MVIVLPESLVNYALGYALLCAAAPTSKTGLIGP